MRTRLSGAAVMLIGLAVAPVAAGADGGCPPQPRAATLADRGQYADALALADGAIAARPGAPSPWIRRARLRAAIGDSLEAIADFTRAIALGSGAAPWLGRAAAHRELGHHTAALADYAEAIRRRPDDGMIYLQRAMTHHRVDAFALEAVDWARAIVLEPVLYWDYGVIYRHRHLYHELLSDHRTALRHPPDSAKAYLNRGTAYRQRRQYCRAVADFDQALALRPGYLQAHLGRGIVHHQRGRHQEAIADLTAVIERRPTQVQARYYRSLSHRALGAHERARADAQAAHRIAPFNPVVEALVRDLVGDPG